MKAALPTQHCRHMWPKPIFVRAHLLIWPHEWLMTDIGQMLTKENEERKSIKLIIHLSRSRTSKQSAMVEEKMGRWELDWLQNLTQRWTLDSLLTSQKRKSSYLTKLTSEWQAENWQLEKSSHRNSLKSRKMGCPTPYISRFQGVGRHLGTSQIPKQINLRILNFCCEILLPKLF